MDEPIVVLAVLALGLFAGVVFATIIYIIALRPPILAADISEDARNTTADPLGKMLEQQLTTIQTLQPKFIQSSEQLIQHSVALESDTLDVSVQHVIVDDIARVLASQSELLQALDDATYGDTLSMRAKRRVLQQQLVRNGEALQRLNVLMASDIQVPTDDVEESEIVAQYNEILMQLDELAKLVQEKSVMHGATIPTPPPAIKTSDGTFIDFDILSEIKGIGPVLSNRLHEAGIYRFEQLAMRDAAEVLAILELPKWRLKDVEAWITQAAQLAAPEGQQA